MNSLVKAIYRPRMIAILALVYSIGTHAAPESVQLSDITRGSLLSRDEFGDIHELPLMKTDVDTEVTGQIARTTITQHFQNTSDNWIEALYLFPLAHDAAVDQMQLHVGDRVIEGQIQEKEQAKATFEKAKEEGKQAALVEQDRPNIFSTSVANIPPRGEVKVTLEYQQGVLWRDGEFSLRIPMAITPRFAASQPAEFKLESSSSFLDGWSILPEQRPQVLPIEEVDNTPDNATSIELTLRPGFELAEIGSIFHTVDVQPNQDGSYSVKLVDGDVRADRDFVLTWHADNNRQPTAAFFSESTKRGDYGLLTLMPPTVEGWTTPAREVIFVVDTSGSMSGQSIEAAREALMEGLNGLTKDDTFNIIEFNSHSFPLFKQPEPAFGSSYRAARDFVRQLEARDGTEMLDALDIALSMPGDSTKLQQVIFITDGSVTNEDQLFAKIHKDLGSRRLFTVGIGSAPNAYFMEEAAQMGRGTFTYVADLSTSESAMKALFKKISQPALTDIRVVGYGVSDITPARIPDLYAGEPLSVAMKLAPGIKRLTIKGRRGNTDWHHTAVIDSVGLNAGIGVDWARKMIVQWQRAGYKGLAQDKVREEVLSLALEHHLVSPYTSLVAVDVTPVRPQTDALKQKTVPPTRPHGLEIRLAKGATGFELSLLLGLMLLITALVLMRQPKEV